MSRKYMRELFNQRHMKCRFCERVRTDRVSDGGVRRPEMKALFHPKPWMSHKQCVRILNNVKWDQLLQELPNMIEEIEELEWMKERFEQECRNARRAIKNVRRLYRNLEAHTMRIEEQLRE